MSHFIPLSSIVVAERQRKAVGKIELQKLRESIERNGLLHAIVVEPKSCEDEGCPHFGTVHIHTNETQLFSLLAGERRLSAIKLLFEEKLQVMYDGAMVELGLIPATFRSELSEVERQEIELEENILRVQLDWKEEAAAIAKLHALREAQKGERQTFTDTAKELNELRSDNISIGKVSRSVLVAAHLSNPKVAKAKDAKTALNIIHKEFEAQIKADLITATDQSSEHELIEGNCIEILARAGNELNKIFLCEGAFDCILTDPPYGMGADKFGDAQQTHSYSDTVDVAFAVATSIFREGFRLCREQAHLYMFCDIDLFLTLKYEAERYGWSPFRTPIIWAKSGSQGIDPWPQLGFRRSYECILYAVKGNKPYNTFLKDCIEAAPISNPYHPAAKPVELYRKLLERSCVPGDRVLDPCCGTGTIFVAANQLKLRATGIELDPNYAQVASNARFGTEL